MNIIRLNAITDDSKSRIIRLIGSLTFIALITIIGLFVTEQVNNTFFQNFTVLNTHILTILFGSALATFAALIVLLQFEGLYAKLSRENNERKQAEKALVKSKAILSRAQKIAHIGNWAWNLKTNKMTWSDEIFKILGYQPQEFQPSFEWLMSRVTPEDRPMIAASLEAALRDNKLFNIDYRVTTADGSVRYVNMVADRIKRDKAGTPEWIYGISQDITRRKETEKALMKSKAILSRAQEIAHIGNWAWDMNTNALTWSDEIYHIFGYNPGDVRPSYEWLKSRVLPDDRQLLFSSLEAALRENRLFNIDFRILTPDGSVRYVNVVADRIKRDKAGNPQWMYGIIQDITRRKQAEKELQDAKGQAEMYIDLMGHDINNMNQIAMGYLELAYDKLENEGRLEKADASLLEKPIEAMKNIARLVGNVKKLQREKLGEYKLKPVDVGCVLADIVTQYSSYVPGRDIKINYSPTTGCMVTANDLIVDLYSNIVGNAIKHSRGPVQIDIVLNPVQEGNRKYCQVTIEDNGPGIPDGLKDQLVKRQCAPGIRFTGKGLGLCLVKTLVEDFHGKMRIEDRVPGQHGKGARFVIMLPLMET
jgi:PAS domain S-box-containing protein